MGSAELHAIERLVKVALRLRRTPTTSKAQDLAKVLGEHQRVYREFVEACDAVVAAREGKNG